MDENRSKRDASLQTWFDSRSTATRYCFAASAGAVAGILAGIGWAAVTFYSGIEFGVVDIAAGALCGWAVWAYSGKLRNAATVGIAIGITALSMVFGRIVLLGLQVRAVLLARPAPFSWAEFGRSSLQDPGRLVAAFDPPDVLFIGLALGGAAWVTWPRKRPTADSFHSPPPSG